MRNKINGWHVASVEAPSGLQYHGWSPCVTWCKSQFGDTAIDGWRYIGQGIFEFRDEKDYAVFLLRWM